MQTARPGVRHRRDIQGLRALAVLIVVVYHADSGALSGGFVGVDVFFVISGFVIGALLLRELQSTARLRLGTFYLRRIRRILPALGLMVLVVALLGLVGAPVGIQPIAARSGAAASVFLGNFYLYRLPDGYFAINADLNPFLHTWSLAVEEQFYLVFPLILLVAWRGGRRWGRQLALGALVVVGVASFALAALMVDGHSVLPGIARPRDFAFFSSITRAWEFAAGAILAFFVTGLARMPRAAREIAGWAGMLMIVAVAFRYDALTPFPGVNAIPPVLGAALLIAAGIDAEPSTSRLLGTRPAVFIGDISYSWYLWHWPCIVYARAVWPGQTAAILAAALSLLPAWLSYKFVENPIRRAERLTSGRTLVMGVAFMTVGALACGVLLVGHRQVLRSSQYRTVRAALTTHRPCPPGVRGNAARAALDPEIAVRCVWPVPAARGRVALLGDSNAGHIVEPVVAAAKARDLSVEIGTSNGCPFADLTMVVAGERREDCRRFFEQSLAGIERTKPDVVVIGSSTSKYFRDPTVAMALGRDGAAEGTAAGKARVWRTGLRRVVRRLADAGVATVVVHPVPKYPGWDLRSCAAGRIVLDQGSCGRTTSRTAADRASALAVAADRRATAGIPQASTLDLFPRLCTATTCSTNRGSTWWYHDGDHLSIVGATRLTGDFDRAIGHALRSARGAVAN